MSSERRRLPAILIRCTLWFRSGRATERRRSGRKSLRQNVPWRRRRFATRPPTARTTSLRAKCQNPRKVSAVMFLNEILRVQHSFLLFSTILTKICEKCLSCFVLFFLVEVRGCLFSFHFLATQPCWQGPCCRYLLNSCHDCFWKKRTRCVTFKKERKNCRWLFYFILFIYFLTRHVNWCCEFVQSRTSVSTLCTSFASFSFADFSSAGNVLTMFCKFVFLFCGVRKMCFCFLVRSAFGSSCTIWCFCLVQYTRFCRSNLCVRFAVSFAHNIVPLCFVRWGVGLEQWLWLGLRWAVWWWIRWPDARRWGGSPTPRTDDRDGTRERNLQPSRETRSPKNQVR